MNEHIIGLEHSLYIANNFAGWMLIDRVLCDAVWCIYYKMSTLIFHIV